MQDSTKTNTTQPGQKWRNDGKNFKNLTRQEENRHTRARNLTEYTLQPCKEIDRQAQHSLQLKMQEKISSPTRALD